jgi:hypothetical protein
MSGWWPANGNKRMKKAPVVVYLLVLVAVALGFRQNEHPKLTGPYLGQKPPGKTPVKFPFDFMPPGYKLRCAPVFTSDGKYFFFLKLVAIPWQAEVYWVLVDALDDLKRSEDGR